MQLTVMEHETDFYKETAARIADVMRNHPRAKVGLSTGRTTKGVHAALAALHRESPFDCSGISIFAIDEITGMSRECKASCYAILLSEVVRPLGISMEHFIMPDPFAEDFEAESRRFEREAMTEPEPDLIVLGLGENGHLGFNQPGTPFGTTAWLSYMDDSLDERLRREYDLPKELKMGGLTLGIKNLMQCRRLIMAANGSNKAEIAHDMITGPVTERLPASVLQLHPCCEVILDGLAAKYLKEETGEER